MHLEPLEARIAPATLVNPTTVTYTDVDGDLVTVTVSQGTLSLNPVISDFTFLNVGLGQRLRVIDFSDDGGEFAGADLKITAERGPLGGDGRANVGFIDSTGSDLGRVFVDGDLGKINAGDGLSTNGLGALTVASLGAWGNSTGAPDLVSVIVGAVGRVTVQGDVRSATLDVRDGIVAGSGDVGRIKIGGSLFGRDVNGPGADGILQIAGDVDVLKIGGDVNGSTGQGNGRIFVGGDVGKLTIGGSLLGGQNANSGNVEIGGDVGPVKIGGSIRGGSAASTGQFIVSGDVGPVKIGGSILGTSNGSGDFLAGGAIQSLRVGGSVFGTVESLDGNGRIRADGDLGPVFIAGDMISYGGDTGHITAGGNIARITIRGSVSHGIGDAAIHSDGSIGPIVIGGDLRGDYLSSAVISARGSSNPTTDATAVAIQSVRIGGTVSEAFILAGFDRDRQPVNPDAQIGSIIAHDWLASGASAGVRPNAGGFGDADDTAIGGGSNILSKIGRIVIRGSIDGDGPGGSNYGFVAQEIGAVRINGFALPLTPGASNDNLNATDARFTLGSNNDFRVREVS